MPLHSKSEDAPAVLSDVVTYEISNIYSRESIILSAQSADLPLGTVMALAADTWQPLTSGLADVNKAAVLIAPVRTSGAVQKTALLVRGAVINPAGLVWGNGLTENEKTAALDMLDVQGVVARS